MCRTFLILLCLLTPMAFAQEEATACKYEPNENVEYLFPGLYQKSLELGLTLCRNALEKDQADAGNIESIIAEFTSLTKQKFIETINFEPFPGAEDVLNTWERNLKSNYEGYKYLDDFNFSNYVSQGKQYLQIGLNSADLYKVYELTPDRKRACDQSALKDCKDTADAINASIHPFHYMITRSVVGASAVKLAKLQNGWQEFIDAARYQTPLDVTFTTWWFGDYYHGPDLVAPRNEQLFLLRPTAVFEYIKGDGINQSNPSLALEWMGINWWRTGIGFSLTSTYQDNDVARSVGHGLTVHLANKFSVGVTDRGGDTSVFVNLDLLQWFGDKQSQYKKYTSYLKQD